MSATRLLSERQWRHALRLEPSEKRRNKYNARRASVEHNGVLLWFASQREADRFCELRIMERAGIIRDLTCQPSYPIDINGIRCGVYRADFLYWHRDKHRWVVEDVKSKPTRTPLYKFKKKCVEAIHHVTIEEIL